MTLVKWNNRPTVFDDINQWFNLATDDFYLNQEYKSNEWNPNFEISQEKDHYLIIAELAGINKKDISIETAEDMIKISGERKEKNDDNINNNFYSNIKYGLFSKSYKLPENVLENKISAEMKNGILYITIPTAKPVIPKTNLIKIK